MRKREGERDRDTQTGMAGGLNLGGTLVQEGKVFELYRKGVKGYTVRMKWSPSVLVSFSMEASQNIEEESEGTLTASARGYHFDPSGHFSPRKN